MIDILPCPHCGGQAALYYRYGKKNYYTWIQCDVCGSRSRAVACGDEPPEYDGEASRQAKRIWNMRWTNFDVMNAKSEDVT